LPRTRRGRSEQWAAAPHHRQWALHPENLDEILDRHPRDGFADETARLVRQEARRNPGCRFACFGPIFPTAVRWSNFATPA
jgi:hypothetical protein